MIVALWCLGDRCRAAVNIKPLRGLPRRILRYRRPTRHLLGDGLLRTAIRHRRTGGGARRDRFVIFLVTTAEPTGQPLQQRQLALVRMLLLGLAAGLAD